MHFFLNLYFQAPKHPLAHVSMQIRTKPRTPSLMALPGIAIYGHFYLFIDAFYPLLCITAGDRRQQAAGLLYSRSVSIH